MKIEISVKAPDLNIEATLYLNELVIWIRKNGMSERRQLTANQTFSLADFLLKNPVEAILEMVTPPPYGKDYNGSFSCNEEVSC